MTSLEAVFEPKADRKVEICAFTVDELMHYWPDIAQSLALVPHTWEDSYTLDSLLHGALEQKLQVWAVGDDTRHRVILFTDVLLTSAGDRHLRIFLAVGQGIVEYLPMLDATLDRFAEIQGCSHVFIEGRDGWERMLRSIGFKKRHITLTRRVKSSLNS